MELRFNRLMRCELCGVGAGGALAAPATGDVACSTMVETKSCRLTRRFTFSGAGAGAGTDLGATATG